MTDGDRTRTAVRALNAVGYCRHKYRHILKISLSSYTTMGRTNTPLELRRSPFKPVRGHNNKSSLLKQGTRHAPKPSTRRVLILLKSLEPLAHQTSLSNVHHTGSNPSDNLHTTARYSPLIISYPLSEKNLLNLSCRRTTAVMSATALLTPVSSASSTCPTSPTVLAARAANSTATLKDGMMRRLSSRNSRTS